METKRRNINSRLNEKTGNLLILEKMPSRGGRTVVRCECLICGRKDYIALLSNISQKEYRSCGCEKYVCREKNSRWMGHGEISLSFFNKIKGSAIERNIPFNITIEEIWNLFLKQNRKCALSGIELNFPKELRDYTQTASLDRIKSDECYCLNNIQWIHKDINYMKIDLKQQDFLNYCKLITEYNKL